METQREAVILAAGEKIAEGEAMARVAEATQKVLLARLAAGDLPDGFDIEGFISHVCDLALADLRAQNRASRDYRSLQNPAAVQ